MKRIGLLKNTIQEYAWGSHTAISSLLGIKEPSTAPQAELWMGAHSKAPSRVKWGDKWISLLDVIEKNPEDVLGRAAAGKFGSRLPYLFKVLAAEKPLSIQAHPNLLQARQGFERENTSGIPLDAPNRNYKDDNHKPECICALTPFWALNGFRRISETCLLLEKIGSKALAAEIDGLKKQPDSHGLKQFFHALMTMDRTRQKQAVDDAVLHSQRLQKEDPIYEWMIKLHNAYPSDPGVLSPIILNLICLAPGQAMFLPAGEPHAYLDGLGIELMANSDNVLRGGLTPKHVDVPELLNVLNFKERDVDILLPRQEKEYERVYASQAEEFLLSVITIGEGAVYTSPADRSIEIVLCTSGKATIIDSGTGDSISMERGTSVVIPAAVERYRTEGDATLYKASVPV